MIEKAQLDRVLILADESADWKVGGLRQLERLVLAVNEVAKAVGRETETEVLVFWRPSGPDGWLPGSAPLSRVCSARRLENLGKDFLILSTRLFVTRGGLAEFFKASEAQILARAGDESTETWNRLQEIVQKAAGLGASSKWKFLQTEDDCVPAERLLLGSAGKPQDGMVSRYLNRPLSRWITRLLLRFPITPTGWTLSIFVFPILSFLFLLRGDYAGFLVGTLLYHVHSILDGCDGEIARAKFLESKRGGRIDDLCDIIGCCLFVIGLGLGLWQQAGGSLAWLYAVEGIVCALLMATNEWILHKPGDKAAPEPSEALPSALYPRHRQLLQSSSLNFLNDRLISVFVQLTKRDVGIVIFILLALFDQAQWILHLSFIGPALTLSLSLMARLAPGRRASQAGTL